MSYLLKLLSGGIKSTSRNIIMANDIDKVIAKANKQNVDWRTFLPETKII